MTHICQWKNKFVYSDHVKHEIKHYKYLIITIVLYIFKWNLAWIHLNFKNFLTVINDIVVLHWVIFNATYSTLLAIFHKNRFINKKVMILWWVLIFMGDPACKCKIIYSRINKNILLGLRSFPFTWLPSSLSE